MVQFFMMKKHFAMILSYLVNTVSMLQTCPASASNWFIKGSAMCCHVSGILCVEDA